MNHATGAGASRSESTEDHLERMQELVEAEGLRPSFRYGNFFGIEPLGGFQHVRRLAGRGFVNYEKYRGFTLTPQGRAVANHIKVRHETLAELLRLLGLSAETVEQEVEVIEHHLKPTAIPPWR